MPEATPANAEPANTDALPEETPADEAPGMPDIDALAARFETDTEATPSPAETSSTPEPEPAATPEPAAAPADDRTARSLELLAEQQRQHREEVRSARAEQEAWASEKAALQADLQKFQDFKTKINRDDALGALADMDIPFDGLTKAVLEGRGVNPTSALADEMAAKVAEAETRLDARLKDIEAREASATRQAQEQEFVAEVTAELANEATGSPIVAALGDWGIQAVYEVFETTAAAQIHRGEQVALPAYPTVIKDVEERILAMIEPLLSLPSVRERILNASSDPVDPSDAAPRTLSNRQAATVPTRTLPTDISHIEDREDRIDALVAKYES